MGFILFARNCRTPDQVRRLVSDLRRAVDRPSAPVLIDQEGGRVTRLGPPHWRQPPPQSVFAGKDPRAAWLNARLIAEELHGLGINVNCLPVLDVPDPLGHEIIGDRAFSDDPNVVAEMGKATCQGLLAGGVLPVIKHIPGHGRAQSDSHHRLPVVGAGREALERVDFAPFRALASMPVAMTAHVVYEAFDPAAPASASAVMVEEVIRRSIGFQGLLISDDIGMNALSETTGKDGTMAERARAVLDAGCDIALHCSGDHDEMSEIANLAPGLTAAAEQRLEAALGQITEPRSFDADAAMVELADLLRQG